MIRAYPRHIRAADLCMGGARRWFSQRGWSWSDFVANGRPASDFRETGDPMAARVADAAEKELKNGR